MQGNQSEVARLRERITLEYQAVNRVFNFTPTARHAFILARQENIALCFAELQEYMSPEEAAELVSIVADEDLLPHVEDSIRSGELD